MKQIPLVAMPNLLLEAKSHFNEPVLIGFDLCRCVGYAEDNEDCYMIVRRQYGKLAWCSFVGGYTYLDCLKGINACKYSSDEKWDDLSRLDSLLALNGSPKETEFMTSSWRGVEGHAGGK